MDALHVVDIAHTINEIANLLPSAPEKWLLYSRALIMLRIGYQIGTKNKNGENGENGEIREHSFFYFFF